MFAGDDWSTTGSRLSTRSPLAASLRLCTTNPSRGVAAAWTPLGDGSMPLPLRVPPDSMTESEVARKVLPRDRTSAVTALLEEHYTSLVRMARLLVDDRETAEDVVMDGFASLYRRWTTVPSSTRFAGRRRPEPRTRSKQSRGRIKRRSARRGTKLCARQFLRYARLLRPGAFTGPMRDGRSP
jgi:hypothetical protein